MKQLRSVEIGKMRQLADFLETVPPEDFDLEHWREREEIRPIALGPIVFRGGCGFAGCAMGWAAHAGIFDGLRVNRNDDLCYRGASGFPAAAMVLGVNNNNAYFFFHTDSYAYFAEPADVAARLRRFAEIVERRVNRRPHLRLAVA